MNRRVFLIVLDSFGIGEEPDADIFGDVGSNTLRSISKSLLFKVPNMRNLGLFNIEGVNRWADREEHPSGTYMRLQEASNGKDSTIGHWEISGIISEHPLPVYPEGFPKEIISEFEKRTGRKVICNQPYSGTEVLTDYGCEHMKTGNLIVYTSGDSVFQIAAHEDIVSLEELYSCCKKAREILTGRHGVGRVIARPFKGEYPEFIRTSNRHDYSMDPPRTTMLDLLENEGYDTYAIGKINDIFAGRGIGNTQRTRSDHEGMIKALKMQKVDFEGLCFINLVDFDTEFGHRRDVDGYAQNATEFDIRLGEFIKNMRPEDILMITADHGCDPAFKGSDHTREYIPLLVYGKDVIKDNNLGTRRTFSDIAATILDIFDIENKLDGTSFKKELMKEVK